MRTPLELATASVPGSSDRMFRKPRLARGTLSLAAPKSGPCSAMLSGRKPSGSRTTTSSPCPVISTMLYAPSNRSRSGRNPHPVGLLVLRLELVGQRVHEDFGVGIALQVVVALGEQFVLEIVVIGELAVEREGEPLGLASVIAFERLGVAPVVAAAGGVTDMTDRRGPVHAAHDRLELLAMIQPERLSDGPHFLVRFEKRVSGRDDNSSSPRRVDPGSACRATSVGSIARRC